MQSFGRRTEQADAPPAPTVTEEQTLVVAVSVQTEASEASQKDLPEDPDVRQKQVKARRPRTLIDPNKEMNVVAVFNGQCYDIHRDVIPEILRFRPDGWKDCALDRPSRLRGGPKPDTGGFADDDKQLEKPKFDVTKLTEMHGSADDDAGVAKMVEESEAAVNTLSADVAAADDED